MIDGLIRWSLNNRVLVVVLAGALLAWGGYLLTTMPVDVLPDLTAPTVTILAEGRGMAPTEMESLVTFPIEAALNGASGVRRVRSATAVGVAIIWTEFDWGEDIYRARQTVTEKLNLARGTLPPEVEVVLAPISSIMGEIVFIALESDRHSLLDLRTTADTVLRRRLLAVAGVSQVTPTGGGQKQYQVLLSPSKLKAYNVSLDEVEDALRKSNENTSAGFRVAGGQEYLIQGIGRISSVDDIAQTVVASRDARPILVRDLGEVRIGEALKRGEGSHDAKPAVILGIQKQPGTNTLELTQRLDVVLDEIQKTLPAGMTIDKHIFRQADFIEIAVHNLLSALRDGGLLVIFVVVLFLANIRASVITLLAIPLSLVAALWGMKAAGLTINTMSLGGLAIAIGGLVDDAIIDVENVFRRLRENSLKPADQRLPVKEVVFRASSEIRASVVFATMIIILVMLPAVPAGERRGPAAEAPRIRLRGCAHGVAGGGADGDAGALFVPVAARQGGVERQRATVRGMAEALVSAHAPLVDASPLAGHRRRSPLADRVWGQFPADGPVVPSGVQRGHADHQRRHFARHQPGAVRRTRPKPGEDTLERAGSGRHGSPYGAHGTRRARSGRGVRRTGRQSQDAEPVEAAGAR